MGKSEISCPMNIVLLVTKIFKIVVVGLLSAVSKEHYGFNIVIYMTLDLKQISHFCMAYPTKSSVPE